MGIFDEAWRISVMKKSCSICGVLALAWKGGQDYCKGCYEKKYQEIVPPVKKIEKETKPEKKKRKKSKERNPLVE